MKQAKKKVSQEEKRQVEQPAEPASVDHNSNEQPAEDITAVGEPLLATKSQSKQPEDK